MTPVLPGVAYNQSPRDGDEFDKDGKVLKIGRPYSVEYSLDPEVWGEAWWETPPTVDTLRPAGIDASTLSVKVKRYDDKPATLVMSGVIGGVRYRIQVTPELSFQIKVTSR